MVKDDRAITKVTAVSVLVAKLTERPLTLAYESFRKPNRNSSVYTISPGEKKKRTSSQGDR